MERQKARMALRKGGGRRDGKDGDGGRGKGESGEKRKSQR